MLYSIITVFISCIVCLMGISIYHKNVKEKKRFTWSYFIELLILVAIFLIISSTVLMYVLCKKYLLVTTGIAIVVVMCVTKEIVRFMLWIEKKATKKEMSSEAITIIFLLSIINNVVVCWFYLQDKELLFTYIAIILGKYIWFDVDSFRKIFIREGKNIKKGLNDLRNNHKDILMIELFVLLGLNIALVFHKYDTTGQALHIIYGILNGAVLGGMIHLLVSILKKYRIIH